MSLDEFQMKVGEHPTSQENIFRADDELMEEGEPSSGQENEDLGETALLEGSEFEVPHPRPDTVVDTDLEEGDVLESNASVEDNIASDSRVSR